MKLIPDSLKKAFSKLWGQDETPSFPATVDIDRKDLTLCVIDEFDTAKRSNAFIARRWGEIAEFVEDGLSSARPMNEQEAGFVGAILSVEQAMHMAGTFDPKIRVSRADVETLVRDAGIAYVAKNSLMARTGDLPLGPPDIENLPPASRDILAVTFAISPEKQALLDKQDRLAMFVLKTRDALGPYVPEAGIDNRPAAEF
jgi:hypothetical protein